MFDLADKAQTGASSVATGLIVFIVVGVVALALAVAATRRK